MFIRTPSWNRIGNRGFTLIELLVVVAIIGMLSSVVLASLNTARAGARDARRLADVKQIQTALELYRDANGGLYPDTASLSGNSGGWVSTHQAGWNSLETALAPYISSLPDDPLNTGWATSGNYGYMMYSNGYGGTGRWYMIVINLERPNPSLQASDGVTTCSGTRFDYGGSGSSGIITLGMSC